MWHLQLLCLRVASRCARYCLGIEGLLLAAPSAKRTQFGAAHGLHEPFDPQETVVAAPELLVGETVEDAVQAGVGVSQHYGSTVDLDGVRVFVVGGHHDGVGRPTDGEDDEDDEKGAGELHGLPPLSGCARGRCHVTLVPRR